MQIKNFTSPKGKTCASENIRVNSFNCTCTVVFKMKNVAETRAAASYVHLLMSNIFLAVAHAHN